MSIRSSNWKTIAIDKTTQVKSKPAIWAVYERKFRAEFNEKHDIVQQVENSKHATGDESVDTMKTRDKMKDGT